MLKIVNYPKRNIRIALRNFFGKNVIADTKSKPRIKFGIQESFVIERPQSFLK